MAKDPAFLFYPGDWMGGTQWMTFEQKGCYMELLILQFNCYQFTEAQAKQVLSICFDLAWPMLKQKFKSDGEFYYNERLRIEIEKRKNYTESRRINALTPKKEDIKKEASVKHMHKHMENENINENIDIIYNEYPSKCPINNRSTGKSSKDKEKIKKLLSIHDVNHLSEVIKLYIQDSIKTKSYIKNFATFLNNLPDINEFKKEQNNGSKETTTTTSTPKPKYL